jgi:hypothetical protein
LKQDITRLAKRRAIDERLTTIEYDRCGNPKAEPCYRPVAGHRRARRDAPAAPLAALRMPITEPIEVTGPPGLAFSSSVINGAKFHNGRIVGGYELPKDASVEAAQAYLDSKRFALTPAEPGGPGEQRYSAEYPNLYVPPLTPGQTTQVIFDPAIAPDSVAPRRVDG